MHLTTDHALAAQKELCKRSLAYFVRKAWHVIEPSTPYTHGKVIDVMCAVLEAVARGDMRRVVINVPPGTMKSTLVGVMFPAWLWGPCGRPGERFVGVAHEQTLGIRDNLKTRRLVSSPWYQRRWGDVVQLTGDQNEKLNFETKQTGFRAVATPSNITGRRGDCLLPGSMVQTNLGEIPIEHLVNAPPSCKVLSYDAHSKRLVHRPIQAVARREATDFYRLHFASGSVVECTGDHRIYTARGYVEARLLSADDVFMRAVPEAGSTQRFRNEESREEGQGRGLLQPPLQPNSGQPTARKVGAELHDLRDENPQRPPALFGKVQSGSVEEAGRLEACRYSRAVMRNVQRAVPPACANLEDAFLLQSVQGSGALGRYGGREQSGLAQRQLPGETIPSGLSSLAESSTRDNPEGRRAMRGLQGNGASTRSPHRYGRREQSLVQSGNLMRAVPHSLSCGGTFQTEEDALLMVERVREPTEVFDIQVEGTRCFFANGILVHNCIIIDDPLSAKNANSQAQREEVNLWFQESLPTRMNDPEKSAVILVMQRLHERDPTGFIELQGWNWDKVVLPMRFEPERASVWDWRTERGELLFPERFPEHVVDELEKTLGSYATAGQLQQRPSPREGGMFKRHWFKTANAIPAGRRSIVRSWDMAATAKNATNDPDYTVGVRMSKGAAGDYLIEGVVRLQESPMVVSQTVKATAERDGVGVRITIPQDPGAAGKAQADQTVRDLSGFAVTVIRPTGDKSTRATPFSVQAEAGNVSLLVTGDPAVDAWIEPFLSEMCLFPAGAHDDIVDSTSDAFNTLSLGSTHTLAGW